MKKFLITLAIFIGSISCAEPSSITSLPNYYMFSRSLEAGYIQSGAKEKVDIFLRAFSHEANKKVIRLIDEHFIVKSTVVYSTVALAYAILISREIKINFTNPIFSHVTNFISINRETVTVGVRLPFW